jgi:hypothetical protein
MSGGAAMRMWVVLDVGVSVEHQHRPFVVVVGRPVSTGYPGTAELLPAALIDRKIGYTPAKTNFFTRGHVVINSS